MRHAKLVALVIFVLIFIMGLAGRADAQRQESAAPSLTGIVTSDAEGPMEGVLVRAKAVGGTVTTVVVSDSQGRYAFPAGRLRPNKYNLSVRAAGYDLDPASRGPVEIAGNKSVTANLKLEKARDIASQLSDAEWYLSIPGTPEQKQALRSANCVQCHSVARPLGSTHTADEFLQIFARMRNHGEGSSPLTPFDNPGAPSNIAALRQYYSEHGGDAAFGMPAAEPAGSTDEATNVSMESRRPLATYMASIDRSQNGKWSYDFKTLPRPTGRATKVIMTEYDLPRGESSQPHDVVVGRDGTVYYGDFALNIIGKLNPETGETKEFTFAPMLPNPPFQPGGLDLEFDSEGNLWFAMMRQAGAAKFDVKTEKITTWHAPTPCYGGVNSLAGHLAPEPKGKIVWVKVFCVQRSDSRVYGIDQNTFQTVKVHPGLPNYYSLYSTSQGDLVGLNMGGNSIFTVNKATSEIITYKTPTQPSGPRRGQMDPQDRTWFAEYNGGNIGMFDPETKRIKEYPVGVPGAEKYTDPYTLSLAKNGEVWSGGMITDYVYRLDPATGKATYYLLPTVEANVRRIWVVNPQNPATPVTVWVGENLHGKLVRIEPLD